MPERTAEIVRRLAERAEDVCRNYLSNGRKIGGYWIVGDRRNAKGRSLYLRLQGPIGGKGARGKWTDGATGEHGDLLDIIASAVGADRHLDALIEAERFLSVCRPLPASNNQQRDAAATRLFAAAEPISGTPAETYIHSRGIECPVTPDALRYHPKCYYRCDDTYRQLAAPAMLAAVTDNTGRIRGLMRTYLSADGSQKAPIDSPRRAMGALAGNGVRFGPHAEVMAVGEGIETMLSLRIAMPTLSMIAALSAAHLAALIPPAQVRRIYIAADSDAAGRNAAARLAQRLSTLSIEAILLTPRRKDFNDDLIADGAGMLAAHLADQLTADDRQRFISARSQ
ncbi:MAG: toprim domain-containing protein [Hyphomonadaceae bacterium]|nr:toprim domain-containing protein [Hyphomonadaceae bacterium]MCB9954480.1 toprim domain-containing protein [Caulobacterales bacterium]